MSVDKANFIQQFTVVNVAVVLSVVLWLATGVGQFH